MRWLPYVVSFVAMGAVDFSYARYFFAAHARKPIAAGSWAGLIVVLNAAVIINYVNEIGTVVAATAGAFVGTVLAVLLTPESKRG